MFFQNRGVPIKNFDRFQLYWFSDFKFDFQEYRSALVCLMEITKILPTVMDIYHVLMASPITKIVPLASGITTL